MIDLKLGKTPARPDAVKLKLSAYLDETKLPTVPKVFGHSQSVTKPFGMLGNDQFGDCVWAGAAHETIVWATAAKRHPVTFTEKSVLSDYSAVTGFRQEDPNTDQGTDMQKAASYRLKTGVLDGVGTRHRISAYLALNGTKELAVASYLFGAVGVGIKFPSSAMEQFNAGKPWTVVKGAEIEGGHYVPLLGRLSNGHFLVCTWGKLQEVTAGFFDEYVDEAIVYLSPDDLNADRSPEGFDSAQLTADLAAL